MNNKTSRPIGIFLVILTTLFIGFSCHNNNTTGADTHASAPDAEVPAVDSGLVGISIAPTSSPPEPYIPLAPLEVYFLDQPTRPIDNGTFGKTYTPSVYVLDNIKKELNGPYRGCFYPNSTSNSNNATPHNTANLEIHLFNNLYGHKGGTKKGLNVVDDAGERFCPGFAPDGADIMLQYVNVHHGQSDNGNYNSRGSAGCGTLHPADVEAFFANFDFSGGFTGTSNGVVAILRADEASLQAMVNELEEIIRAPGTPLAANAPDTLTSLATIRERMHKKYQGGKEKLDNLQKELPIDPQTGCRACDTRFLARLAAKQQLDTAQFADLLCIDQEECDQNVEFTQFYNEVLYRVALEEPGSFLKSLKGKNVDLPRIRKYLHTPLHLGMDFPKVRAALQKANRDNRGMYRAELRALLDN